MRVRDLDDPIEFQKLAGEFVRRSERHNFLFIGIMVSADHYDSFRGWIVDSDDDVLAAALQTNNYNLILSASDDPESVRFLARHVGEIPGVVGVRPEVDHFVAARLEEPLLVMDQGLYVLTDVADLSDSPGSSRLAVSADIPLVVDWVNAFQAEALGEIDAEGNEVVVTRRIHAPDHEAGFMLFEVDGSVVSLSGHSGPTGSGIKIAPVYTPVEQRGHGYATHLVADQSRWLLEQGYESCFLYTDLSNPTSNAIYQRIGFEKVGESAQYEFTPVR